MENERSGWLTALYFQALLYQTNSNKDVSMLIL